MSTLVLTVPFWFYTPVRCIPQSLTTPFPLLHKNFLYYTTMIFRRGFSFVNSSSDSFCFRIQCVDNPFLVRSIYLIVHIPVRTVQSPFSVFGQTTLTLLVLMTTTPVSLLVSGLKYFRKSEPGIIPET